MQPPEIPEDEPRRLRTLTELGLLDTEPEPEFDRITRLASDCLECPIAVISLIDRDRQWFKARHGLSVQETPREISFCGHTILGDELFVVEDARDDPRFRDNPLVLGEAQVVFYAGFPIHSPDGQALGTLAVIDHVPRTLDQRARGALSDLGRIAEQAILLRATNALQQQRLEQFVHNAPAAIAYFDRDMRYLAASQRWRDDYGLGDAPLVGRSHYDVFPEIGEDWKAGHRQTLAGEPERSAMDRFPRANGVVDWVRFENYPWRDLGGEIAGIVMFTEVITNNVRESRLLQLRLEWLEALDEASDQERFSTAVSEVAQDLLGARGARLVLGEATAEPQGVQVPLEYRDRPFGALELDLDRGLEPDEQVWVADLARLCAEVVWRERQQQELEAAQRRYAELFEVCGGPLVVLSPEGVVLDANPAALGLLEAEADAVRGADFVARYLAEDGREGFRQALASSLEQAPQPPRETGVLTPRGVRTVVWSLRAWQQRPGQRALVADGHDLTDQRKLEEGLRRSQRLEALGQLAGGVAHDFNNMLSAILGHVELALQQLPPGAASLGRRLERIQSAGESSARLTAKLLAFARGQSLTNEVVDLNDVVSRTLELLERTLDASVTLTLRTDPDPCWVCVDPTQLEQALVNLAVNARDAMPQGGSLSLSTEHAHVDAAYAAAHPGAEVGDYVRLTVSDTGSGMSPEVQARVFEPFFTTKPAGQGTGLGLAGVHGFVGQSGGTITVYSELGQGTTFKILLPASEPRVTLDPSPADQGVRLSRARVLLAEDQSMVRELIAEFLETDGHEVVACESGRVALETYREDPSGFDILITDLVMPDLGGGELLQAMGNVVIPVVLMSGYAEEAAAKFLPPGVRYVFLPKPISPSKLRQTVNELLDEMALERPEE
ncbi:MAG: PAS domain-containing protein [Planctomycetota bacterium]